MTASFVLDSSVALAWCFPEEGTPASTRLLDRMATEAATVPALWFLEIANVLAVAERRRRIRPAEAAEFIAVVECLDLEVDDQSPRLIFSQVLPLCRAHALTSYDAAYLELSIRRQLPLATLDDSLRAAAKAAGVKVLGKGRG